MPCPVVRVHDPPADAAGPGPDMQREVIGLLLLYRGAEPPAVSVCDFAGGGIKQSGEGGDERSDPKNNDNLEIGSEKVARAVSHQRIPLSKG